MEDAHRWAARRCPHQQQPGGQGGHSLWNPPGAGVPGCLLRAGCLADTDSLGRVSVCVFFPPLGSPLYPRFLEAAKQSWAVTDAVDGDTFSKASSPERAGPCGHGAGPQAEEPGAGGQPWVAGPQLRAFSGKPTINLEQPPPYFSQERRKRPPCTYTGDNNGLPAKSPRAEFLLAEVQAGPSELGPGGGQAAPRRLCPQRAATHSSASQTPALCDVNTSQAEGAVTSQV